MTQRVDQTMLLHDPVSLFEPELRRAVAEQREQGVVLGQRVWQLHDVTDEERPEAAAPTRLGLERIRMGDRPVVGNGQLGEPLEDAVGSRGSETFGAETRGERREARLLSLELGARRKQGAVMA